MQAAIDCHSRYAWARLYTNKLPVTAVQLLNNHVLPTFDKHRAAIQAILSDNGREFCGRPRSASLRTVPTARRDRAPHYQDQLAPDQRLRRAVAPNYPRRTLPHRRTKNVV